MKLSDLECGKWALVTEINLPPKQKLRLLDMGLKEGVKVKVIRSALLKTPIEIYLCNFYLGLRLKDAENIEVKL